MIDLTKRLQSVTPPDPLSGNEDNQNDPDLSQGNDNGDGNEGSGGRDLNNVLRETRRRQDDFALRMEQRLATMEDRVMGKLSGLVDRAGSAADQNTGSGGKPTIAELRQARDAEEDSGKRAQWNDLIIEELADQKANAAVQGYAATKAIEDREERANTEAVHRFPDLVNPASDFHVAVQKELATRHDADRPGVILDVANEVAIAMGISPITSLQTREAPSVARGNSHGKPTQKGQDKQDEELGVINDEEFDAIAERLAPAMRGGKFTKEHRESIKNKDREMKQLLQEYGPGAFAG